MINAYCDGGGNNTTKRDFYGSFVVDGYPIQRYYYDFDHPNVGTTNEAEYQTLILLLDYLLDNNISDVLIHSDSKLVVNQVNGIWRRNNERMDAYWWLAIQRIEKLKNVKLEWVGRKTIVSILGH